MIYGSVNEAVLELVPLDAKSVLDVGCGDGTFGAALKRRGSCRVVGVTHSKEEAALARAVLDEVIEADLEHPLPGVDAQFDCIVCSHVLEHLRAPAASLRGLVRHLAPSGRVVIALPNVLYWRQRLEFLKGRFRYTNGGLMDRTHLVFFDWQTARNLVHDAGLVVSVAQSVGGFPGSRWLPLVGPRIDRAATKVAPGVFGVQFVLVAKAGE